MDVCTTEMEKRFLEGFRALTSNEQKAVRAFLLHGDDRLLVAIFNKRGDQFNRTDYITNAHLIK